MLYLRTCKKDGTSHNEFKWPLKAGKKVKAPDWDPKPVCGGGLHGLLNGQGDASLLCWDEDAIWMVFEYKGKKSVDLNGKHKVPEATVKIVGDRKTATQFLVDAGCVGVIGSTATAGDRGTATAGYSGVILIHYNHGIAWRIKCGMIGENGLKPNTPYKLDTNHNFMEVKEPL